MTTWKEIRLCGFGQSQLASPAETEISGQCTGKRRLQCRPFGRDFVECRLFQFGLARVQENYRRILETAKRVVFSMEHNRQGRNGRRRNSLNGFTTTQTPENETSQVEFQEGLTAKSLKISRSHGKTLIWEHR